jgi:hypothetical protein
LTSASPASNGGAFAVQWEPNTRESEMKTAVQCHIDAIRSGSVTKTNVVGLRKMLNNLERSSRGYSVSSRASLMSNDERDLILDHLLPNIRPLVIGELHDSGKRLLKNRRYEKKLSSVYEIILDLKEFRLVGFDYVGPYGMQVTPVYRAYDSKGKSFPYCCLSWQAGGNGPELMSVNYF